MKSFFALGVLVVFWTLLNAATMIVNIENFAVIYTVRMVFVCAMPFSILWFFLNFCNSKIIKYKAVKYLILLLAAFDIIMVLTNPLHLLMFKNYNYPIPENGTYFWVHLGLSFAAIIFAFTELIVYICRTAKRNPLVILTGAGTLIPYIINMLFTFDVISYAFDLTPFGFFITILLFANFSYRSQLLNLKTTALADIFETINDVIIIEDANGKITDVNGSFCREFNDFKIKSGESGIKDFAAYLNKIAINITPLRLLDDFAEKNLLPSGEFSVKTRGNIKTYTVSMRKIVSEGWRKKSGGFLIKISDVSEYKAMIDEINEKNESLKVLKEEADAASLAKSYFLSNMSHEIRTPLNAIVGMAQVADRSKGDAAKTAESVERIKTASQHLLGIISDVLDMSKIEAGKFELNIEPFCLLDAITEVSNLILERCTDKNLDFKCRTNVPKSIIVDGDKLRLKQILINLLGNAVKFTPVNGKIVFRAEMTEDNFGARVTFKIIDSGIGMTAEQIGKLFGAFEQTDSKITSKFGGTGLGLAISQNLANMMGGQISVESTLNKGSEFSLILDFKVSAAEPDATFIFKEADLKGKHILLAEDIEINRIIVQELFMDTGVIITEAENGEIAVKMFNDSPQNYYDVIFMDIQMPVMDGYEATRQIRKLPRSDAKTVPIFAMSANVFQEDRVSALNAGMNHHISKPIDYNAVMNALNEYLK